MLQIYSDEPYVLPKQHLAAVVWKKQNRRTHDRDAFHLFQHVLGQDGDVSQFGRLPELIAKRRWVPGQSTAAVVQGNSLAGNAEQPVPETAPGCIALVDSVQRFQPSLLVQVFRDRPVAPNKVENKAVDLVKMAIDSGTPGGAVAPASER